MGLVDFVRSTVDQRKKLDPQELKKAKPVRNPTLTWTKIEGGSIVIELALKVEKKGPFSFVAKLAKNPGSKQFELEPIGAFVWERCDGKTTVEGISKKLREEYKMNRLEADASLSAFLQMLSRRGLITLMVKNDVRK